MNTSAYITANLLLFTSWFLFLYSKREILSFTDRILGTFILGLSQIIITEMVLGIIFEKLFVKPLFLFNITISSGVLLFAFVSWSNTDDEGISRFLVSILKEIKSLLSDLFRTVRQDMILMVLFCLFVLMIVWQIFLGYLFPSYSWDALWYHLPIVGHIMQSGAVTEIPNHSFINQFMNIFPKNIELFFLWNIIFLKSDVITDLSQLLFGLMGVLAVYGISIKLGVRKNHAIYSAILFFFTPILLLQLTTNYVDIAISALYMIILNFLASSNMSNVSVSVGELPGRNHKKIILLLTGLSAGILLGAKGSGPLYLALISAGVIVSEYIKGSRVNAFRRVAKDYMLYILVPALILGGYWYAKNWILYGNPVYPMEIKLFDVTVFKGLYDEMIEPAPEIIKRLSALERPFYVWMENVRYYLYDSRLGGLGPIWFILFLPAIVFVTIYSIVNRKYRFLAISLMFIALFLLHPRNWTPRYVIFMVGLGAISFGMLLDYLSERQISLKIMALLLVIYTSFIANSQCVTPEKIKKFIDLPADERNIARQAPFNIDLYTRQDYGYWIWISKNIIAGDTLVYTFEPLFLSPLWNSAFSSSIAYVKSGTYKDWTKSLRAENATYVLLRTNSQEDRWIEVSYSLRWLGPKEKFEIVYADDNYKIARFMQI